jgi:hypothetical protein
LRSNFGKAATGRHHPVKEDPASRYGRQPRKRALPNELAASSSQIETWVNPDPMTGASMPGLIE